MSYENKQKPEDVVFLYDKAVERYEPRMRKGIIPFLGNLIRGQFQKRPSEIAREAEQELEIRNQTAQDYAAQNLPELKQQAAAEARAAEKEVRPL